MSNAEFLFENFDSSNPAEIARPFAEQVRLDSDYDHEFHKNITLPYLDQFAVDNDLIGSSFLVETNKAFSLPVSYESDEEVRYIKFNKLTFEGSLGTHSLIQIGKLGGQSVKALCLCFPEALLLPYFDHIPEDHLLHTPVLAVEDASRTS